MKTCQLMLSLLALPALAIGVEPETVPRAAGIESAGYVWNEMEGEKLLALQAKGDVSRGAVAFEVCQGCHRNGGTGRVDGSYPRLAGQHASVLIKQMTDIRAGRRDNRKMEPFSSEHVLGPQEIADIAAYLQAQPVTPDNGQGPGKDQGRAGKLYQRDCADCHGTQGEGDAAAFYPRLSGQHYRYLRREALLIRDGGRRNSNPDMVKSVRNYSDRDLEIVSDYASRLPLP